MDKERALFEKIMRGETVYVRINKEDPNSRQIKLSSRSVYGVRWYTITDLATGEVDKYYKDRVIPRIHIWSVCFDEWEELDALPAPKEV